MAADRTYDGDLTLWAEDQARALRSAAQARVNAPIDWENVAEEIESLGRSQARELASRVRTILEHLIKLQTSPATDPRPGWRQTILRERAEIEGVLKDSPSLRRTLPDVIAAQIGMARRLIALDLADRGETPTIDPASISYTAEQLLGDWLPADPVA